MQKIYAFGFMFYVLFSFLFCFCANHSQQEKQTYQEEKQIAQKPNALLTTVEFSKPIQLKLDSFQTLIIESHAVDIVSPSPKIAFKGNIIVLPGWNFSRQDWCKNSSLCYKALAKGYRLILPEMGKSIYATQEYPETRKDWRGFPTKTWVIKHMIPTLQEKYQILLPEQKNYLVGLSTGARGVAMLALALPDLFTAGAALSGDYEQTLMPNDNLMRGFYGNLAQFPERWKGEDNPYFQVQKLKTPLYLGHGTQDLISPPQQTKLFYEAIRKHLPHLKVKLNMPSAGHDYKYWDSEVDNILQFFEEI
ncbi:MAG: prolyl oligopeptidase family serine peptidase [Microscillaceae bacterium]|nr:prolyl oligopeptidase family serine peptidase [Microscillaceae bacterium]MDW8460903.1 prolyl oligopeptidase family serine peptidase [Cytophagales bacterium]